MTLNETLKIVTAWEELKTNNCPYSHSHHMQIFSNLIECKILPNESINIFSTRIQQMYNEIKGIDSNFDSVH